MKGQLSFLRNRGWDVSLVSSPGEGLVLAGKREGVDTRSIAMQRELSPLKDLVALFQWWILLVRLRPGVLSVGTPKAGLLGIVAGFFSFVPRRVYVVRGLRFEGANGFKRLILKLVEKLTCVLATDVIVVSQSVAEQLRRERVYSSPMVLIGSGSSNGVMPLSSSFDIEQRRSLIRDLYDISSDQFVFGFVGRPSPDKGGDVLLASVPLLRTEGPHPVVFIVGSGGSGVKRYYSGDVRIIELGWVDDPLDVMCAFDVLVLPTMREGFPNVVLEAACLGIPSVSTYATGARDAVLHEKTGLLVKVGDPESLAFALNRLAFDSVLCAKLGEAAAARAEREFAPEIVWEGLDAIYRGEPHSSSRVSYV